MDNSVDESGIGESSSHEADYQRWGHGKTAGLGFREVAAVEVRLEALGGEPLFTDPELREHLFERALYDPGMRACCVLPDGMWLIYDKTVDLLLVLWSLRVQTEEYAEIYGAPEGRVWAEGLRLRPIRTHEEVLDRAAALLQLPIERGLAECLEAYRFMTSAFHDDEGRLLAEGRRSRFKP